MKIAIIGAGNIGAGLGRACAAKGHEVVFGVRDPSEAKTQAAVLATGGRATATTLVIAVRDVDVVALAIPFGAVAGVLEAAGSLAGKVVIDCTNPAGITPPPEVTSGAELIARLAIGALVVKYFNAQGAENVANPRYGDEVATNFYCGDDDCAKQVARALIADVGFDAVDVGPLKNARLIESATQLWFAASRMLGTRRVAFRMLRDELDEDAS